MKPMTTRHAHGHGFDRHCIVPTYWQRCPLCHGVVAPNTARKARRRLALVVFGLAIVSSAVVLLAT